MVKQMHYVHISTNWMWDCVEYKHRYTDAVRNMKTTRNTKLTQMCNLKTYVYRKGIVQPNNKLHIGFLTLKTVYRQGKETNCVIWVNHLFKLWTLPLYSRQFLLKYNICWLVQNKVRLNHFMYNKILDTKAVYILS